MTFEETLEQFNAYARKLANQYGKAMEFEDAYQLARIGVWKAYELYDVSRGVSFMTLMQKCVFNEIMQAYRKIKKRRQLEAPVSLDDFMTDDEPDRLFELVADPHDGYGAIEAMECLLHTLTKEQLAMCRKMASGRNQREIAEEEGLSQSYISRKQIKIRQIVENALYEC